MTDEPRLRVVGEDERAPEMDGKLSIVVDDLEVALGHVTEACAELSHVPEDATGLLLTLMGIEEALSVALRAARERLGP